MKIKDVKALKNQIFIYLAEITFGLSNDRLVYWWYDWIPVPSPPPFSVAIATLPPASGTVGMHCISIRYYANPLHLSIPIHDVEGAIV